jgi:sortase (surface protein transpeptidase)
MHAAPSDLGLVPVPTDTFAEPDPETSAEPARSAPTNISIPTIGVAAQIMSLGVNTDGTVQVPPLDQAQLAGWYNLGPSPGEIGNAVIMGHVDSRKIGPAVFFRLGELRPGDVIQVTRTDKTVVKFSVDGVKSYPKAAFPTELVYGPSDKASLRVVTCGGIFDEKKRSYPDDIIVFATLAPA